VCVKVLHVDPLLGNDHKIRTCMSSFARQWLTSVYSNRHERNNCIAIEDRYFSARSVQLLCSGPVSIISGELLDELMSKL
jgi:hypothetical protein